MKAWEEYAFVKDGIVQNVACFNIGGYTAANIMVREVYGEGAIAVNVCQIPTTIGDTYRDGVFYRKDAEGNEQEVPTIATEEEAVEELQSTTSDNTTNIESNTSAIDDILVMILDDTGDLSGLEDIETTDTEADADTEAADTDTTDTTA
jgi:hypothetical protein